MRNVINKAVLTLRRDALQVPIYIKHGSEIPKSKVRKVEALSRLPTSCWSTASLSSYIMAASNVSQSRYLGIACGVFATLYVGFGINAILRPRNGLEFFEFQPPASASDREMVDGLMIVYGARDIFMGVAIHAAALFGNRQTLGWIMIASSAVAFVDGAVCRAYSGGEWNHWSYAPFLTLTGSLLLGIFDRRWEQRIYTRVCRGGTFHITNAGYWRLWHVLKLLSQSSSILVGFFPSI